MQHVVDTPICANMHSGMYHKISHGRASVPAESVQPPQEIGEEHVNVKIKQFHTDVKVIEKASRLGNSRLPASVKKRSGEEDAW